MKKTNYLGLICLLLLAALCLSNATQSEAATYCTLGNGKKVDTNRYFYNQLDADGKMLYNKYLSYAKKEKIGSFTIKKSKLKNKKNFNKYPYTVDVILGAMEADNPRLRGKTGFTFKLNKKKKTAVFTNTRENCFMNMGQMKKANLIIDSWAKSIDSKADRYTKIRQILKLIYDKVLYDYSQPANRLSNNNDTIVGATLYGKSVCAGIAITFKALCDEVGVPCIMVGNDSHAWDIVQMEDGKWYAIDCVQYICKNEGETKEDYEEQISAKLTLTFMGADHIAESYSLLNPVGLYLTRNDKWENFKWPTIAKTDYVYTGKGTNFSYGTIPKVNYKEKKKFVFIKRYDNTYMLYDYYGPSKGTLTIPKKYKGKKVTEIYRDAFCNCNFTKVIIPNTIKFIGSQAFARNKNLTSVVMSKNVEEMFEDVFIGCDKLKQVKMSVPKKAYIDKAAFNGTKGIVTRRKK